MPILIGPAGSGGTDPESFAKLDELGLDAVEVEFTYSVWMKKEAALKIKELNKEWGLKLSIHAPYFINLASDDPEKVAASKQRILKCCERGHELGVKYICFHAGFYQKKSKEETYSLIKEALVTLLTEIKNNKWSVVLAPETTGKATQFGDLDELIRLKKEIGTHLTVDFAHLKARYNGMVDYDAIIKQLKPLGHIHAHFSGIAYGEKGEKHHLMLEDKEIRELFTLLKKHDLDVTIICESPDPLADAVKMKKMLVKGF